MLVVTLMVALLLPQVEPIDVGVSSAGKFAFDWDTLHDDGTPGAATTGVEFHYIPVPPIAAPGPGDGHFTVNLDLAAQTGENVIPMRIALVGVPSGIYDLNVRLIGVGGNFSGYSSPVLAVRVRVKNPSTPTGLRVVGD